MPVQCRLALSSSAAVAEDFFAGLDVSWGKVSGGSRTTNGGGAIGGGGTVYDLAFRQSLGVGMHAGYRLDHAFSASVSYEYIQTGVSWKASYVDPLAGDGAFDGSAVSNLLMANATFRHPISDSTSFELRGGLGAAINVLANVVETDITSGALVSNVGQGVSVSPAARLGVGLSHEIAPHALLALNTSATYLGGFTTGETRFGNLGTTAITPYTIENAWRAEISASLRVGF